MAPKKIAPGFNVAAFNQVKLLEEVSRFYREFQLQTVMMLPRPAFVHWFRTQWGLDVEEAVSFEPRVELRLIFSILCS